MKVLIVIMLVVSGCAGKTIHQECNEIETAKKYKDYDQCYAAITSERLEKRKDRRSRGPLFKNTATKCTTNGTLSGNNYTGSTDCN